MTALLALWAVASIVLALVLAQVMGDTYELDFEALVNSAARAA